VKIDEDMLASRANISRDLVYQYFLNLSKMKVISYIPTKKTPLVIFTEERLDEKALHIPFEDYEARKNRFKHRLDAMVEYAFSEHDCRNNLILKYFGQPTSKPCGACDVCRSRLENTLTNEKLTDLKKDIILLLRKNPQYLGEIQETLEIKEDLLNSIITEFLEEEKLVHLDDGRLALA
jgi:ATP-dependent DNA helicase RecQ